MVQGECHAAVVIFSSTSAMSRRATDLRAPVMLNTSSPILPSQRKRKNLRSAVAPRGNMLDKSPVSMHRLQVN